MSIHWLLNGQWGMLNNMLYLLFGIDGPIYLNDALDRACVEYRGLYLEDYAILDDHPAGRKDGGPAGALRGGGGGWRRWPAPVRACDAAADGEPVYCLRTARYHLYPRRLQLDVFRSGGGPAMSTEVLATLGIRYAFTTALPRLGVATVMTALPANTAGDHTDAQVAHERGAVVSATTVTVRSKA